MPSGQFSKSLAAMALPGVWPLDARFGLYTSAPSDNALGDEYGAAGYAKVIARRILAPDIPEDGPPQLWNQDAIVFGPFGPGGVGAEIGWVACFAPAGPTTAADMLMYWELDEHKTPLAGDSLVIDPGQLVMALE